MIQIQCVFSCTFVIPFVPLSQFFKIIIYFSYVRKALLIQRCRVTSFLVYFYSGAVAFFRFVSYCEFLMCQHLCRREKHYHDLFLVRHHHCYCCYCCYCYRQYSLRHCSWWKIICTDCTEHAQNWWENVWWLCRTAAVTVHLHKSTARDHVPIDSQLRATCPKSPWVK